MTREEHISNLETIGCDGWTVTTEAYKSLQFAIKALEREPSYENEIEGLQNRLDIAEYGEERLREEVINLEEKIKALEQKPKTGHWVIKKDEEGKTRKCKCDKCGYETNQYTWKNPNYCANCGVKMLNAESEEK